MSTPADWDNQPQPLQQPGGNEARHAEEPEMVEVTFIAPLVVSPTEETNLAAVDAPVAAGGGIAAPIPGAGAFSFAIVTGRVGALWAALTRNPKVMIGLIVVVLFLLVALFGPLLVHTDPNAISADALQPPSSAHWLGTTQTGQDVFAQLIYGTRTTILWGFFTALLVTFLSLVVGLTAGYFGGIVDELLSLLINIFLVMPAFALAVLLAAIIPYKGPLTVAIVIVITGWAFAARILRAQTLSMRKRDFIEAVKVRGETTWRIIFFELLPNEIAIVTAGFIGTVIFVILTEVGLEFLGLGDPSTVSWGSMFYWAQNGNALLRGAWWWFVPPGLCIAALGTALTLMNFGIDEIANPRLRREPKPKAARTKEAVAS